MEGIVRIADDVQSNPDKYSEEIPEAVNRMLADKGYSESQEALDLLDLATIEYVSGKATKKIEPPKAKVESSEPPKAINWLEPEDAPVGNGFNWL